MRTLSIVLVVLAVAGLAGVAQAARDGAKPKPAPGLMGVVVKVDGADVTIKAGKGADAKEVVVKTDADTKVTVDGQDGKVADLKAGMMVKVSPADGTAKKIDAKAAAVKTPK